MKVIVLNKGRFEDFHQQLQNFDAKDESKERILATKKSGDIIVCAPRTVLPCGVIFHVDTVEKGCALRFDLPCTFRIDPEQIFVEVKDGIYYSGPLAWQQSRTPPFRYLSSWDFRKIFVFENGDLILKMNMAPGTRIEEFAKEYPESYKILEVWCMEWEYSEKYVIDYWFEWGGQCLWGGNRKTHEKYGYAIDVDELPLSDQTKKRVKDMGRWHDTALDWSNPGWGESPWTDEERKRFAEAASQLLEDLQKELGDEFEVVRG